MDEKRKNKPEKKSRNPEKNLNGTEDIWHIVTIIITAVCSVLMILLVNGILYNAAGSGALQWMGLKSFLEGKTVSLIISSKTSAFICIILIIILMAANGWLYRHVKKKIFEHYSIVFTAGGAVTLIFMLGTSQKGLYLITGGILLLTGSILFLIYGIEYHALNRKLAGNDRQNA